MDHRTCPFFWWIEQSEMKKSNTMDGMERLLEYFFFYHRWINHLNNIIFIFNSIIWTIPLHIIKGGRELPKIFKASQYLMVSSKGKSKQKEKKYLGLLLWKILHKFKWRLSFYVTEGKRFNRRLHRLSFDKRKKKPI